MSFFSKIFKGTTKHADTPVVSRESPKRGSEMNSAPHSGVQRASHEMKQPEIITLFFYSAQGRTESGEKVHLGSDGYYSMSDQKAYIKHWGPAGTNEDEYEIPESVEKTREAINRYLSEEKKVHIPPM